jgi:hypothetical protein
VSIADPVIPGDPLPIRFDVKNISSETRDVIDGATPTLYSYAIEGSDGGRFDSLQAAMGSLGGRFVQPSRLEPGGTASPLTSGIPVQFPGPLTISARCLKEDFAPLTVQVSQAGEPIPGPAEAIDRAVEASGGLFTGCAPGADGTAVHGEIQPPSGSEVGPMDARCTAAMTAYPGFAVVTLTIVAPSDAGEVVVGGDGLFPDPDNVKFPDQPTVEVVVWRFVLTHDRTVGVSGFSIARTQGADVMAPYWEVSPTGWQGPGGSRCGGQWASGGGTGHEVSIEFVNACPGF